VRCWKPARKHATIQASPGTPGIAVTAVEFVETTLGLRLDISQRIKDTFAILPMRWMVERTFAWIGNYRRLSKDYGILKSTAENMVRIAMLRIMVAKCV
jgi:putative transposase